jgi:hypothetical protein
VKRKGRDCTALLFFCSIFLLSFGDVEAQTAAVQNPLGPFAHSIERRLSEQDLRALPLKLRERRERNMKDPKILELMNEDFLRLQTIRADMVKTFSTGKLIEPGVLKDLAADVKRRASRLRSMLVFSDESGATKPKIEKPRTVESLNDQAFRMCIEISRFTENPIFKSKGAITARLSSEADQTLELVVRLAGSIQKGSANLHKK